MFKWFLKTLAFAAVFSGSFHVDTVEAKPLVLAHYMPWFQYPSNSYHWPPSAGTYYTPIIGYYSSQNETVIQWQLSLMQAVGIDGVIVDWYGVGNANDYPFIKASTEVLWRYVKQFGMKLGICYDMNSSPDWNTLQSSMSYLNDNFFNSNNYIRDSNGNLVMLLWPSYNVASYMNKNSWDTLKNNIGQSSMKIFLEYLNPAWSDSIDNGDDYGTFGWVYPQGKSTDQNTQIQQCKDQIDSYYGQTNNPFGVGALYKGFSDHYVSPGTGTTNPYNAYGLINSDYGYLSYTYDWSNKDTTEIFQIPTWNDYSEGTIIEPARPTNGCVYGCQDNYNPYNDLLTLYSHFGDGQHSPDEMQKILEGITQKYFG